MKEVVAGIELAIVDVQKLFLGFNEHQLTYKINPQKWSRKEILGHLIDSAQNNIQRFVRGQYEQNPRIVYAQNEWVKFQNYQTYNSEALLQLWVLLNKHLCKVLLELNAASYANTVDTGKTSVELHTLQFLAEDYLSHLLNHVKQLKS